MRIINIQEAKKQLSKLVDQAVNGEAFIIAKAGNRWLKSSSLMLQKYNLPCASAL